jgi:hypothetical protein
MVAQINPRNSRTSERVPAKPRTRSQLWLKGSGRAPAREMEVRRRNPGEQTRVTSESRRRQLPERPSVNAVLHHLEVQGLVVGLEQPRRRALVPPSDLTVTRPGGARAKRALKPAARGGRLLRRAAGQDSRGPRPETAELRVSEGRHSVPSERGLRSLMRRDALSACILEAGMRPTTRKRSYNLTHLRSRRRDASSRPRRTTRLSNRRSGNETQSD